MEDSPLASCVQRPPLWKKYLKGLDLQTILTAHVPIKIIGLFMVKSIWKAWEAFKLWLQWHGKKSSSGGSLSSLNVWLSHVLKFERLPLANI